ncbi:MAG: amidase [Alphaproteobacteria bacterium]|nr:amidase [Alphaproteobacteria bacterium]
MTRYQSIQALHDVAADRDTRIAQTAATLDALDTTGRALDGVTFLDRDFALTQAAELSYTGHPLCGVPLAHKELYGRQGWPDEGGSQSHQGELAATTAHTITALDNAGAIDCGRLTSVEFALGVTGHNDYAGTPQNPWNRDYICGGSSSGSGAMVAAGIIPAALGSDTGGSIRLPAAACGLVGVKPSHGLVSRHGIFPLSESLDTAGPLTRSVEDAAIMLDAIIGHDPRDPASLDVTMPPLRDGMEDGLAGMRIVRAEDHFLTGVDTAVADATEEVFRDAAGLGAEITSLTIPDMDRANILNVMLIACEAAERHLDTVRAHHPSMNEQTVMRVVTGAYTTAAEKAKLARLRATMARQVIDHVFTDHDVLITPVWPFLLPTIADSDIGAKPEAAPLMQRIGHNTRPFNFLGLPVVVVPIGRDANGLPLSVQLVGKPFSEAKLLRAARGFERHYAFWDKRPEHF